MPALKQRRWSCRLLARRSRRFCRSIRRSITLVNIKEAGGGRVAAYRDGSAAGGVRVVVRDDGRRVLGLGGDTFGRYGGRSRARSLVQGQLGLVSHQCSAVTDHDGSWLQRRRAGALLKRQRSSSPKGVVIAYHWRRHGRHWSRRGRWASTYQPTLVLAPGARRAAVLDALGGGPVTARHREGIDAVLSPAGRPACLRIAC